ncbi:hypothetical protein LCGC14_1151320 [marine sediment metagenome]|uniref:Uncharacterized protein n=1 Tax=marine sediment metagenome TaxID=412755 RepID=A0A0F9MIL7_9ZZZZ
MSGIDPKEIEAASKQFQEAIKELTDAQTYNQYADASKKGHQAVAKLDPEERRAKLQELQNNVEAARKKLFDTQEEFRQRMQSQMETTRQNMAMNRMPGGAGMGRWPGMGAMGAIGGMGAMAPVVPRSKSEMVFVCPECGNQNVNWKSFKGKKARKAYAKRYGLEERQLRREGGVRICIQCTQRTGRDVRMIEMPLGDVQKIKEDYQQKRIDGTLFKKAKKKGRKS